MLFPTLDFLLFFTVIALLMWALRAHHEARKLLLVVASYWFYAQWNWRFCFLLAFSSLVTWLAGLALERTARRRLVVGVAVTVHLLLLGTFKYYDFFVGSLNELLRAAGLEREIPFFEILLPVGISFFTFHGISYVVDVYRGQVGVCRRPTDMLLYLSFFPQLVAGPIVRAAQFLPQLYAPRPGPVRLGLAAALILGGLFKKVVLANYLATELVDPVFFDPAAYGTGALLLAAYGYAAQIYCDFSAYTDMAIGLAALLGYRFPPNFDQPYRAASLQEFWRRWHISLSSWLRDYLYKPLGGSRHGDGRTALNLMLTMLLGGIWHGAAWRFVLWGALHGAWLVTERALFRAGVPAPPWPVRVLIVFHLVCLAWIPFRAPDMEAVGTFLAGIAALAPGTEDLRVVTPFTLLLVAGGLALHFLPPGLPGRVAQRLRGWPAWALGAAGGVAVALVDALGPDGVAPFIYFQF